MILSPIEIETSRTANSIFNGSNFASVISFMQRFKQIFCQNLLVLVEKKRETFSARFFINLYGEQEEMIFWGMIFFILNRVFYCDNAVIILETF